MRAINQDEFDEQENTQLPKLFRKKYIKIGRDYGFDEITELSEIRRLAEIESRCKQNW